jgi:acyl carrier protein
MPREQVLHLIQAKVDSFDRKTEVEIGPETRFGELGLHSLKLIEIIFDLETHLGTSIDEERLMSVDKIHDLVDLFACSDNSTHSVAV